MPLYDAVGHQLDRRRPIWSAPKQPSEGGAGWACPAAWNAVLTVWVMRGAKSHNTRDGRDNKAVVYKTKRPSLPPPTPSSAWAPALVAEGLPDLGQSPLPPAG